MHYILKSCYAIALVCLLYGCSNTNDSSGPQDAPPNILFIILDDVGIDQMQAFGYGGATPPQTPHINAIAGAGVSFRNLWAMPECSPSRALVFEGRFPLRTNVTDAILAVDLANSQVPPYESTTPVILRERGYQSALFGKFHLTGSNVNQTATDNNPLGFTAVHQLGWDFFKGWQEGAPFPIDTTAGGVAAEGVSYSCGFVPGSGSPNGSDAGACYFVDSSCEELASSEQAPTPGRTCLERGGIFVPDAACSVGSVPANVDFTLQNGYYVGELLVNQPDGSYEIYPPDDPSGAARSYRSIIESNWAIDWIRNQSAGVPWMATVSYSSAHSPFQQPPTSLLPPDSVPTAGFDCESAGDQRVLSNQMIESMDREIGRVLVESGIATFDDGALQLTPEHANTMIVVLGDNGTYAPAVKAPFNPVRSKGTVYQTGVWTPLIVAGSLVEEPGRDVDAMVNIADVFQLFAEIAGIDVHDVVPPSRQLDSVAMLPYLENPAQQPIRETNFAQLGENIQPVGYEVPPCVIPLGSAAICIQLFAAQSLCNSEGGVWWGEPDGSNPAGVGAGAPQSSCCAVNEYQAANNAKPYSVQPSSQLAMRNADYKLVQATTTNWDVQSSACQTETVTEFYAVDEGIPPKLDNEHADLLASGHALTPAEQEAYDGLSLALEDVLDSNVSCVGDGNRDGVIDELDIEQLQYWRELTGLSSWYDFDLNGLTNEADLAFITAGSLPRDCP
ncbi:MAG: sulfatase-like hydrolase/transferase [Halioglobus sp.]|nr:sulfatase-like hydrolase/transferase [Halioglobus sp.]